MDGYERRKQKKTEHIFRAAFDLHAKYGYSKVSVNEIARAANVSPATIFNYFGSKEQLFEELIEDWIDKQLLRYETILIADLPFSDKVKELLALESANLQWLYGSNRQEGEPNAQVGIGESGNEKIRTFYAKLISLGREERWIPAGYSDEIVLRYYSMYARELQQAGDQEIDGLIQLFFYGLNGPPS